MIAVDTNMLVYAHREESTFHAAASRVLADLAEGVRPWAIPSSQTQGPMIHDARIAAVCIQHGVRELLSADRDFGRFRQLSVLNPLTG